MASPAIADPFAPQGGRRVPAPIFAFVDDQMSAHVVENDLGPATGEAITIHEGGLARALAQTDWPPNLGGLLIDITDAPAAVNDVAVLLSVLPRNCIVVAIGEANDIGLFRDLTGIGVADYIVKPVRTGILVEAFERAASNRQREAALSRATAAAQASASGNAQVTHEKARVISVIGSRGGSGATTAVIALGSMIGQRAGKEVLIVDLDLHFGSLMLALDLDANNALSEALMQPDRIDNFFIDQSVLKKTDHLCVLGAEEPPQSQFHFHPAAIDRLIDELQRRFAWIVVDVPRADPVMQRHILQASTDVMILCDLSLPGVRDAMRLQQLVQEINAGARVHILTSGTVDPRRAPVKVADLERSLKRKVDVQIPFDDKNASAAINSGRPLPEAAPTSGVVKALAPFVTALIGDAGKGARRSFIGRLFGKA